MTLVKNCKKPETYSTLDIHNDEDTDDIPTQSVNNEDMEDVESQLSELPFLERILKTQKLLEQNCQRVDEGLKKIKITFPGN